MLGATSFSIREQCAKDIRLCNILRSTQPNDRKTVIDGYMRRDADKRSRILLADPAVYCANLGKSRLYLELRSSDGHKQSYVW